MAVLRQRQFLNLIVAGRYPGVKSLRRINLPQLFNHRDTDTPPPPPPPPSKTVMETIRLPRPSFTFRALNNGGNLNCFPLGDSNEVICRDPSGHSFICDVDSRTARAMPPLPKLLPTANNNPVSVFVPEHHVDDTDDDFPDSLFLMERFPQPAICCGGDDDDDVDYVPNRKSEPQFVVFLNDNELGLRYASKCFSCRLLPPPPFVEETWNWCNDDNTPTEITAYGVVAVDGGRRSHVCISVQGVGTYCLDAANHKWSHVGRWMLPFRGKVEYVPELKLWFGLSADADADAGRRQFLAAADLSDMMDSSQQPPQLVAGPWKELVDPPEEWKECKDPQFVSLGSGRFCIARFFQEEAAGSAAAGDQVIHENNVAVFTGVEVNSSGKGDTTGEQVQMTPHRSRRVRVSCNTSIETVF